MRRSGSGRYQAQVLGRWRTILDREFPKIRSLFSDSHEKRTSELYKNGHIFLCRVPILEWPSGSPSKRRPVPTTELLLRNFIQITIIGIYSK